MARIFESEAREHAKRLVQDGTLPADAIVGRWWRDEIAEIDVLALVDDDPVLVGECRWQAKEINERDLAELRGKLRHLPAGSPRAELVYAFWSRGGPTAALARHPDVRAYTAADLLGEV